MRPGVPGKGGTGTGANEEQQGPTASERKRALPEALMEEVIEPKNLNRAYQRVKANKGAPGVDGMSVDDLGGWLAEHWEELVASLLEGSYQPQPVRGVEIPKPGGGVRQLGIPTVVDRLVQQGILQVLDPLLDPTFSESSYGFRPGRNAHQALGHIHLCLGPAILLVGGAYFDQQVGNLPYLPRLRFGDSSDDVHGYLSFL